MVMSKIAYTSTRWRQLRTKVLNSHPLCAIHLQSGKLVPATIVDHIKPHRGNPELFWDEANLQSLCKRCHDSVKQRLEKSGVDIGCDVTGMPLGKREHW